MTFNSRLTAKLFKYNWLRSMLELYL